MTAVPDWNYRHPFPLGLDRRCVAVSPQAWPTQPGVDLARRVRAGDPPRVHGRSGRGTRQMPSRWLALADDKTVGREGNRTDNVDEPGIVQGHEIRDKMKRLDNAFDQIILDYPEGIRKLSRVDGEGAGEPRPSRDKLPR
jgi:hypothetical protein